MTCKKKKLFDIPGLANNPVTFVVNVDTSGIDNYKPQENFIEAPFNGFPSETIGPSGEHIYWSPKGAINPRCSEFKESILIQKLFDKTVLDWADIVCPVDIGILQEAKESNAGLEELKRQSFCDEAIPFVSISSISLGEEYFENNYFICYFASRPYKIENKKYIAVGVIGN